MSVGSVPGRRFSPLDRILKLRADHWSDGAARVAAQQGLQAQSFDLAAEGYAEAVGGAMSPDGLRRVTQGWGQTGEVWRVAEAERANAPGHVGEGPRDRRVADIEPIAGPANLSTDGAILWVRGEGWKEVKLTAISAVQVKAAGERTVQTGQRAHDPLVALSRHSYERACGMRTRWLSTNTLKACGAGWTDANG
jgi:hypothetical protein